MLEIHNFTQNEIDNDWFEKVAREVISCVKKNELSFDFKEEELEISLAIVGDGRIRKLNKMYRGKNKVTDVLAFAEKSVLEYLKKAFPKIKQIPREENSFVEAPDGISRLGEIVICYPRAKKQARRAGHSLEEELSVLLIHGILHLLGYDHEKSEEEQEKMKSLSSEILSSLS